MQHPDPRRDSVRGGHLPPPAGAATSGSPPPVDGAPGGSAAICLSAPALLVEARFREITLATRLLRADRPGRFTIGPGRGADAPVNPAWLPASLNSADDQLRPPAGRTHAGRVRRQPEPGDGRPALDRPPATAVAARRRAPRGAAGVARGRAPADPVRRGDLRDPGGGAPPRHSPPVAPCRMADGAALPRRRGAGSRGFDGRPAMDAVGPARAVAGRLRCGSPAGPDGGDPSRRDGAGRRIGRGRLPASPAGGSRGAAGPSGQAGASRAPRRDARRAVAGSAKTDPREAAATIRSSGVLSVLSASRSAAVADVLNAGPAIGADARDALGHLQGVAIADAYGAMGWAASGPGRTPRGQVNGRSAAVRRLRDDRPLRQPRRQRPVRHEGRHRSGRERRMVPDILLGVASVRGSLDKEIIRRTVRRHLNEVRYCYTTHWRRTPRCRAASSCSSRSRRPAACSPRCCPARRWETWPWNRASWPRCAGGSFPSPRAVGSPASPTRSSFRQPGSDHSCASNSS